MLKKNLNFEKNADSKRDAKRAQVISQRKGIGGDESIERGRPVFFIFG